MRNAHTLACRSPRAKKGFTLTEIAIVLGIIGTILGAIWSAAAHANQNQKTTKAVQEVLTIVQGMKALFPNSILPAGDTKNLNVTAVANGIVPLDLVAGGVPQDPWATELDISSGSGEAGANMNKGANYLGLWFTGLTQQQCVGMLANLGSQANAIGLQEIYSDGTAPTKEYDGTWNAGTFATCAGNVILNFNLSN